MGQGRPIVFLFALHLNVSVGDDGIGHDSVFEGVMVAVAVVVVGHPRHHGRVGAVVTTHAWAACVALALEEVVDDEVRRLHVRLLLSLAERAPGPVHPAFGVGGWAFHRSSSRTGRTVAAPLGSGRA